MAIATLLIATLILKLTGMAGAEGMQAAIAIGSIICIVAAISGDTSQDLKTGFLLGATPRKQQIGELIGVAAAALAIGATLFLLNEAWGFGSAELAAPQATLMKMVIEGIMFGKLPWGLILVGVFIAVVVEVLGLPVMAVAIGIYLPVQLNACIMVGGIIRWFFNRMKEGIRKDAAINNGVLYCSGMIAGEGLVGILMAVLAIIPIGGKTLADFLDLSGSLNSLPTLLGKINVNGQSIANIPAVANVLDRLPTWLANTGSLVLFAVIIAVLLIFCLKKDKKQAVIETPAE